MTVDLPREPGQGKRRGRRVTARGNAVAAHERLRELEEQARGVDRPGQPPSETAPVEIPQDALLLADWLHTWLERSVNRHRAVATQERYASIVRLYLNPRAGHLEIAQVTPATFDDLELGLIDDGLSPKTVHLIDPHGDVQRRPVRGAHGCRGTQSGVLGGPPGL